MEAESVPVPAAIQLSPPSFEEALRTSLIGRKWPPTMRSILEKVASRVPLEQIAQDTRISVDWIERCIDTFVRASRCQQPQRPRKTLKHNKAARRASDRLGKHALNVPPTMIGAECQNCGVRIEEDEERAVLIAAATQWVNEEDSGHIPTLNVREVFHYCASCTQGEEVRLRNPWRTGHGLTPEDLELRKELATLEAAEESMEAATVENHLRERVVHGDVHAFNKAMPTTPGRADAMARSVLACDIEARADIGKFQSGSMDAKEGGSGSFDQMASTDSPSYPSIYGPDALKTGRPSQEAKVLEYLDSPRSRNKLTDNERTAARLTLEGQSQETIGKKLGRDRSVISKYWNNVVRQAFAPS